MSDIETLLMACQFGDGQFPSGAFGFSWGLEGLVTDGLVARGDLVPFILGQLEGRWAGFDRVFVAHAHDSAGDRGGVVRAWMRGWKPSALPAPSGRDRGARGALCSASMPGWERRERRSSGGWWRRGRRRGMPPWRWGWCWRGLDWRAVPALALSGYGFVSGLTTAAIRLGVASHIDMQQAISCRKAGDRGPGGGSAAADRRGRVVLSPDRDRHDAPRRPLHAPLLELTR